MRPFCFGALSRSAAAPAQLRSLGVQRSGRIRVLLEGRGRSGAWQDMTPTVAAAAAAAQLERGGCRRSMRGRHGRLVGDIGGGFRPSPALGSASAAPSVASAGRLLQAPLLCGHE